MKESLSSTTLSRSSFRGILESVAEGLARGDLDSGPREQRVVCTRRVDFGQAGRGGLFELHLDTRGLCRHAALKARRPHLPRRHGKLQRGLFWSLDLPTIVLLDPLRLDVALRHTLLAWKLQVEHRALGGTPRLSGAARAPAGRGRDGVQARAGSHIEQGKHRTHLKGLAPGKAGEFVMHDVKHA